MVVLKNSFHNLQSHYIVGVFNESRYWDIYAEYAKNTPNDILIQITIANRGPEKARLHVLPTHCGSVTHGSGAANMRDAL